MARSGNSNIISFDDARRMASTRSSRPSAGSMDEAAFASSAVGRRRSSAGVSSYRVAQASSRDRSRPSVVNGSSPTEASVSSYSSPSTSSPVFSSTSAARASRGIRLANAPRAVSRDFSSLSRESSPRPAIEVYDERDVENDDSERYGSRPDGKRRAKAKKKAERLFARQFGADDAEPSACASRAAVYKGEMGRSHKRAFSDLGSGRAANSSGVRGMSAREGKVRRSSTPPLAVFAGVMACMAFALFLLFPAAQQFYVESREQARLQAEYDALSARNEAIESQVEHLKTDEGIEDAARKELGWVYDGQTAGVVQGLDEEHASSHDSLIAQVKSGSVSAPETWYSPLLDALFGYVDPSKVTPENTDLSNVSDVAADQTGEEDASAS